MEKLKDTWQKLKAVNKAIRRAETAIKNIPGWIATQADKDKAIADQQKNLANAQAEKLKLMIQLMSEAAEECYILDPETERYILLNTDRLE